MISTSRCKVLTVMLATYSRGSGLAIFDIALELAGRQLRRRSKISTFEQHLFYVAIDQAHVRITVDRMKPNTSSAEQDQNDICKRARAQTAGDGQMEPSSNPAFFPLAFEFIER